MTIFSVMNVKMFISLKDKCNWACYLYFGGMKLVILQLYLYIHPKKALLVPMVQKV